MGKRFLSIALVLILVITIALVPLAQPAEAVAGVVVAGAVVAVMAMAGITIVTSGMTAAQVQDWVEDKLEEWAADVGSPLDHLINSAGIGVTISGLLTIGTAAAQGINQFINWLKSDLGLVDNTTSPVISDAGINLSDYFDITNTSGTWSVVNNTITVGNSTGGTNSVTLVSKSPVYNIQFDFSYVRGGNRYYPIMIYSNQSYMNYTWTNLLNCYNDTSNQLYASEGYTNGSGHLFASNSQNAAFTISIRSYEYNNGFGTVTLSNIQMDGANLPGTGESLDIVTGVITIPQVQNDDKVFLDVGALPGSTVSEVTEGVLTDVVTETLGVSGTVAEEEPEYVITGPVSVSGLDDIFPFCIPFDLYHMCEALAADPVAPHFEWRFYVPRVVDYTIVIDLSGFNTVAQILRVMETLLFCVGLAFETRKLIRS